MRKDPHRPREDEGEAPTCGGCFSTDARGSL
uniref:Uncharacterized protein n=1 Tax=Arundo donax TaxID=35708 RepID=A0A0A9ANL0_ARUDO